MSSIRPVFLTAPAYRLPTILTVHVVSHTHWDREWYHPAERFRQQLVALIDELLDDASDRATFLLDGQTVVLEDYLDVRPERASELAAALRDGRLEAGPWFVLADELIPSGEGLVRNLLAGRRTLRALRAKAPPVLYCPDSFGHPAALPLVAQGFGCPVIVLWRGAGGATTPDRDVFRWRATDGDAALAYHLTRSGYELGVNLPMDEERARDRWMSLRKSLAERSALDLVVLPNGADHHARQRGRAAALDTLARVASADAIRVSTLREFGEELEHRAGTVTVPEYRGELRDSYGYTWTLQGTLATRTPQKRRYVQRERDLLRDVEPWLSLSVFYAAPSRRQLLDAAWRPVLLCQPHDTLCGTSVDRVAHAMDRRLESAAAQATGVRQLALESWIGHDREIAREKPDQWTPQLLVRNRAARARGGIALVELTARIADVPVGPGSAHVAISDHVLPKVPKLSGAGPVQVLSRRLDHDRVESPRAYPDNDAVLRLQAAVWVDEVPAYGVLPLPLTSARARTPKSFERVRAERGVVTNGLLTVRFHRNGSVSLEQGDRALEDFMRWESRRDRGDLYTPAVREEKLTPRLLNTRLIHRGPVRATVEQRWRLRNREGRVDARLRFVLDAGAPWLRVQIAGVNAARDHRLRLRFQTDVQDGRTVADAAFGWVERSEIHCSEEAARMEEPVRTAPLHRYVSLFDRRAGLTLFSDGLTEYECDSDAIAVTLLRSVGELSRSDIAERPGHAGWPAATPDAQCIGPFEGEIALMLHGPRSPATTDLIERSADDVLYPLTGDTLRSAVERYRPVHGVTLDGAGLAFSSAKESEDGEWLVLRCVNLLEQDAEGAWRLARPVREAHLARMDETPLTPLRAQNDTVAFLAPARGVVTILVK